MSCGVRYREGKGGLRSCPVDPSFLISVQVGLMLSIMVAFFVFTSQTVFIKFGRYDKYLSESWGLLGARQMIC